MKDIIVGVDYSDEKDKTAISWMTDNKTIHSEVFDSYEDIIKKYLGLKEQWLINNGVTEENAHEYKIEVQGLNCVLLHNGKRISTLTVYQ
jgi:ATP-dependent phosphoenolpyruvate carboxykinase